MTRWKYRDSTGTDREGELVDFMDHGGTDVTHLYRRDDGTFDAVSGQRLKDAKLIYVKDISEDKT